MIAEEIQEMEKCLFRISLRRKAPAAIDYMYELWILSDIDLFSEQHNDCYDRFEQRKYQYCIYRW